MLVKKNILYILTIIISLVLINTSVTALDQGTVDFTIEADKMARMDPESPDLTLDLSMEKALNEGNVQSNSISINFQANTDISIEFNQKPEKFEYEILNEGIYYKMINENGDTIGSFGVDDQGEVWQHPNAGETTIEFEAQFDPDKVNNLESSWWEMPADTYSDKIIEITITDNG